MSLKGEDVGPRGASEFKRVDASWLMRRDRWTESADIPKTDLDDKTVASSSRSLPSIARGWRCRTAESQRFSPVKRVPEPLSPSPAGWALDPLSSLSIVLPDRIGATITRCRGWVHGQVASPLADRPAAAAQHERRREAREAQDGDDQGHGDEDHEPGKGVHVARRALDVHDGARVCVSVRVNDEPAGCNPSRATASSKG
ncbi:hypothetical protein PCL_06631 [Purpureocillium lilacinum]|uniref:Uncharacterized protein n=1 Tax=Purpureocillium lilacinum TaxID=33203 RepID=A0A2U3EN91_PURLI|nr:hypothetical protein PCL_06631 [Purpureocillium lilacinum]